MPETFQMHDRLLRVRGTVQGVGYRPFVLRLANELGITGWVRNDSQGVLVRAIGSEENLLQLEERLMSRAPAAARVTKVEWVEPITDALPARGTFAIVESALLAGETETAAPVDSTPCPECRREFWDTSDRRYGYPFINCTQCGPRYSIIERLPYDRPQTTMRLFRMCPACEREYRDPTDRRFHAEPNACPVCGPRLLLADANGRAICDGDSALKKAAEALCSGQILAVKGLGGFHLVADASDEVAIAELRRRKHREEKPLAVMFHDLPMLRLWAEVSDGAAELLESAQGPIVLVPRRLLPALAPSVAPGNPWVGAMLPPTPLHLKLTALVERPLVATSANLSEEPLCTDDQEAFSRLNGIADLFLGHNRVIARPVDDSVVRFTAGGSPIVLRRARGYAPAPFGLPGRLEAPVLCLGAQMKNTVAVASADRVMLSPHIGDLEGAATHRVFTRTISMLGELNSARFARVACDKHPDYASTRYAEGSGLPVVAVQHHLAHVLAVLLEHRHPADGVLGVAWDGTGYGEDGTIWGGEFILLRAGKAVRFGHFRPFRLAGGEAAVRDARRVAISLTSALGADASIRLSAELGFSNAETGTLHKMMEQGLNSPLCSSVGRLFDGVGALLGLGRWNTYEGQTPLGVEVAASRAPRGTGALPFCVAPSVGGGGLEIDWRPAVEAALSSGRKNAEGTAADFHRGLIKILVEVASRSGVGTVALSGGCFQNALLRDLADSALERSGFRVLAPISLPPNDGAIAAGQALGALWNLTEVERPEVPLDGGTTKTN